MKKKWDYEELGREKTIDFWVIITNAGSGGRESIALYFYDANQGRIKTRTTCYISPPHYIKS